MREESDKRRKTKVITKEKLDLHQLFKAPEVGLSVAGQPATRTDALSKATGKLMFGADYSQEGYLYGKILRSPHPHALIKSINVAKAERLPGVVAVLTA